MVQGEGPLGGKGRIADRIEGDWGDGQKKEEKGVNGSCDWGQSKAGKWPAGGEETSWAARDQEGGAGSEGGQEGERPGNNWRRRWWQWQWKRR